MSGPLSTQADVVVYLNGEFIPGNQAHVGVMTHGFSYGTGCFEGIRGYYNADTDNVYLFRLREHFERLHQSCRIMNITLNQSVQELMEIATELIRRNNFHENCYIRPFAYKSDEIIGVRLNNLTDHLTMIAVPMGDYAPTTGLRCCVSSWRRIDDNAIPARAKISGAYVNSAFAKTEALTNGFDEAIMLTSEGHVSEGSAENLFMVVNGELITPPATENILLGITRDTVMELARTELDMKVTERVIDRTELYVADEILLTGTGAQICPVIEVDRRPVGTGQIGHVGHQVQNLYLDVVRGKFAKYMDWCTPVFAASKAKHNGNGHQPAGRTRKRAVAAQS